MSVGDRVAHLRAAHAESLREAALRTGVSHTTIARIERGEVTGSFHKTIQKIALGYGVKVELLLAGRDPGQEFRSHLSRLSHDDRCQLYFITPIDRTKMVMDFIMVEFVNEFSIDHLAPAIGLSKDQTEMLLDGTTGSIRLTDQQIHRTGERLSRITGIPSQWFHSGSLGDDQADPMPAEHTKAYLNLIQRASKAGIQPSVLEMAINLLIAKNK